MLRTLTTLTVLALVAACVSPEQQCRIAATRDLGRLDRMIATTEADLARGFRLIPVPDALRVDFLACVEDEGTVGFCVAELNRPDYVREEINVTAERAKLDSLRQQRPAAEAAARRALASCPATSAG